MAGKSKRVIILGAAGRDFHNFNLFFRNNSKIDAKAIKKDKYYIIWLNKGIIDLFNRYFVTYFYLDEIDELKKYSSLESQLIDSIGKLMYK